MRPSWSLRGWYDAWSTARRARGSALMDAWDGACGALADAILRLRSDLGLSRLRPLADSAYRLAHEVVEERIRGVEHFSCPHLVDRVWNRYVYPLIDRIEVGV